MAKLGRPFVYQEGDKRPVTISLRVPAEVYTRLKQYTSTHHQSITEVLLEGLQWRLKGVDPQGQTPNALQDSRDNIQYYYNTVRQQLQGMVEGAVEAALAKRKLGASTVPMDNVHAAQHDIQCDNSNTVIQEPVGEVGVPPDDIPHYHNTVIREVVLEGISPGDMSHYDNTVLQEEAPAAPVPDAEVPLFDTAKYRLGKLCPKQHEWGASGQSLRVRNKAGYCLQCNTELVRAKRQRHPAKGH